MATTPQDNMQPTRRITISFNILLILYSVLYGVVAFALTKEAQALPVQGLVLTSLVDFVRYLIVMVVSAYFVREVWNRLIADIFAVRKIWYREAVTTVVILGVLGT